jgi:hypothetical protein
MSSEAHAFSSQGISAVVFVEDSISLTGCRYTRRVTKERLVLMRARTVSAVVAACDFALGVAYRDYPPLAVLYVLAGLLFLVAGSLTRSSRRAFLAVGAAQWMALAVLGFALGQTGRAVGSFVFGAVIVLAMFFPSRGRPTPTGEEDLDTGDPSSHPPMQR